MQIDTKTYKEAVVTYEATWHLFDRTLYDLCRKHPRHKDRDHVHAKLWIVGRSYATGIERAVLSDGTQGGSMLKVADLFLGNHKQIDGWLDELAGATGPLIPSQMAIVVSVHGQFVNMLSTITRDEQSSRSFVSKYLHFHHPIVPIYDSVAADVFPSVVRWSNSLMVFNKPAHADEVYMWYTMRFIRLYDMLCDAGCKPTVKLVDNFLLALADIRKRVVISKPG